MAGRVQHADAPARAARPAPGRAPIAEALAAGYARWGERLLERMRGPVRARRLGRRARRGLLAQDQLGGRSLFTFLDGPRLCFATEISVLLRLLRRRPDPDELALAHHLVDHSVPDGRMLFHGIRRLGGGCLLELSDTGRAERRYWTPRYQPPLRAPRGRARRAAARRAEDGGAGRVARARRQRAAAQRRALTRRWSPRSRPRALPTCRRSRPPSPSPSSTRPRGRGGSPTPRASPSPRCPSSSASRSDAAEAYLRAWELPLPTPGILVEAPLIAAAARLGAGVVLDGQGGDELFGAAHFLIADRVRRLRPLSAWRLSRRHPWLGDDPPLRHVWPRLHQRRRPRRAPARPARARPPAPARGALHAGLAAPGPARLYRDSQDPWRWKRLDGPRWWASLADTLTRGRETADLADYVRRRGAMGAVQARSPLLHLGLVELALRMPPETNFDPVTSRPLVREALAGALPADVLARRDKRDFSGAASPTAVERTQPRTDPAAPRRTERRRRRVRRPTAPAPRASRPTAGRRRPGVAPVGGPRLERRDGRAVATRQRVNSTVERRDLRPVAHES